MIKKIKNLLRKICLIPSDKRIKVVSTNEEAGLGKDFIRNCKQKIYTKILIIFQKPATHLIS